MTDIRVTEDGTLLFGGRRFRCALGRSGLTDHKREGDGATPVGCFPFRRVLYRADRLDPPQTALSVRPIDPDDGWCDDPAHRSYNRPVRLHFEGSCETLFRNDHVYDLIAVLGHNDEPPVPFAGSAIFLHLARPDYGPTEGCVALAPEVMLAVLAAVGPDDRLCIARKAGNGGRTDAPS